MARLSLPLTLLPFFLAFAQPQARAQASSSAVPACPAGNLLAGKLPVAWQEIARDRALLTDETVANEGAAWDASLAALFETGASTLIALGYHDVKTRQWERRLLRLTMGAAGAVAVLVPVSFVTSGGLSICPQFLRNTAKHSETPLTNLIGLRTVLDFRPAETAGRMNTPSMVDQWSRWKQLAAELAAKFSATKLFHYQFQHAQRDGRAAHLDVACHLGCLRADCA
jgi:hypothetical protein